MSFNVIATEPFERKLKRLAKKYKSIADDLKPISEQENISDKELKLLIKILSNDDI
jgi:mRNA-degrading endonuclease RelE of RelBE toxin-antitoxin system